MRSGGRCGAGALYCAPRCGANCTWEAHVLACERAVALAKRLGPGWSPRVWENVGWHYQATCNDAHVNAYHHVTGKVTYTLFLNTSAVVSCSLVQIVLSDPDPVALVRRGIREMRNLIRTVTTEIDAVEMATGE